MVIERTYNFKKPEKVRIRDAWRLGADYLNTTDQESVTLDLTRIIGLQQSILWIGDGWTNQILEQTRTNKSRTRIPPAGDLNKSENTKLEREPELSHQHEKRDGEAEIEFERFKILLAVTWSAK